mmetsp:Transcript_20208/g.46805  ORF Transcript_20208/g.46805 Transcript_20208/m.46805 type:complete len:245 (+) Transcript_20208:1704-2438(+)
MGGQQTTWWIHPDGSHETLYENPISRTTACIECQRESMRTQHRGNLYGNSRQSRYTSPTDRQSLNSFWCGNVREQNHNHYSVGYNLIVEKTLKEVGYIRIASLFLLLLFWFLLRRRCLHTGRVGNDRITQFGQPRFVARCIGRLLILLAPNHLQRRRRWQCLPQGVLGGIPISRTLGIPQQHTLDQIFLMLPGRVHGCGTFLFFLLISQDPFTPSIGHFIHRHGLLLVLFRFFGTLFFLQTNKA